MAALTMFDKVWRGHVIKEENESAPAVLYVDRHLLHEVTSPQAFDALRERGLKVRSPERCLATVDHSIPTEAAQRSSYDAFRDDVAAKQARQLETNCSEHGITLHGLGDERQGIIHVIAPELGAITPGATVVCGDSHTSTHGAFGALAFGIGTSQVAHVLATQCLLMRKPKTMRIKIEGELARGVSAKDVILYVLSKIGAGGGTGHVIEYCGSTIQAMSMEARMTLCNMSIEAGARAGMIAPDETTFAYLQERLGPRDTEAWQAQCDQWRAIATDDGATFDASHEFDATGITPMVTYGTSPDHGIGVHGKVPEDADAKALEYMGVQPGQPIAQQKADVVFIGSCTNSRISDLREAASVLRGRHVSEHTRTLVVPGSQEVKRMAEAEGLDRVFMDAGCEWREPGCSMCIAMNGDMLESGQFCVSTSNRNFVGRQGSGGRTMLASPLTAAASAIKGCVADPREFMQEGSE